MSGWHEGVTSPATAAVPLIVLLVKEVYRLVVEVLLFAPLLVIGVLILYLKWLSMAKENYKLRHTVSAQNSELSELRELILAMDTGENTEQLLREVHERAMREHKLKALEYGTG